jgi:rare lipoprotein A
MRRPIAHGLAVFFCVASLGAVQGNSGSDQSLRCSAVQKQRKASRKAKLSQKTKAYQVGTASWYGSYFHGKETASGEPFDMYDLTAAHPTLPLGTYLEVTNLRNGRAVVVRINDRGPVVEGRIIDLSYAAALALDLKNRGIQQVRLDLVQQPVVLADLRPVARID